MARFFAAVDAGGRAIIRQSRPGKDARNGALKDMLFDADYQPPLVLGSGEIRVDGFRTLALQTKTQAHGLSRKPDMLLAVAACRTYTTGALDKWKGNSSTPNVPYIAPWEPNLANMDRKYCGPFYVSSYISGPEASGGGACGWWCEVDASNIYVRHFLPEYETGAVYMTVKWTALRLS